MAIALRNVRQRGKCAVRSRGAQACQVNGLFGSFPKCTASKPIRNACASARLTRRNNDHGGRPGFSHLQNGFCQIASRVPGRCRDHPCVLRGTVPGFLECFAADPRSSTSTSFFSKKPDKFPEFRGTSIFASLPLTTMSSPRLHSNNFAGTHTSPFRFTATAQPILGLYWHRVILGALATAFGRETIPIDRPSSTAALHKAQTPSPTNPHTSSALG